jgi:hypothetical protein
MVHWPSSTPMDLQMALARGSLAVPLKIFTRQLVQVKKENRRSRRMNYRKESNNRQNWRKLNLPSARKKVPADAATAYGLIYRHTRQAPSSHWAKPH